jgi:hypothetical protein
MLTLALAASLLAPTQGQRAMNDLKQLALAYHNYNDAFNKAPEKPEDLGPFVENDQRLLGLLKNKDLVFNFGFSLKQISNTTGTANTVLAYEKDAGTKPAFVAFFDGSVKKLAPEDFKKAIQPKK